MPSSESGSNDISKLVTHGLRPNSEKALEVALQYVQDEGVGGVLIIRIPENNTKPVEMQFVSGRPEIDIRAKG